MGGLAADWLAGSRYGVRQVNGEQATLGSGPWRVAPSDGSRPAGEFAVDEQLPAFLETRPASVTYARLVG